ncbi:hypothetical protein RE428_03720 [Marinobacter nanhaiticus D15-8W]|uniref:Uncharacterized protein n=1 Tax=Marinobacter nanhaiticus D15-8W TaxID=626887 RepID=N6VXG1_9GAMM|nr:hypothetical protein [Marinobacter nanhaiticus]ENO14950.1 hypothetical protein J057_06356 [Marinobacter nanhaiticus D15-8W]BES69354.1 hypothetical protein RE428_03720 [Marinobacter nanhaiticus D15-8W]
MFEWISNYSTALQITLGILTLGVWYFYGHILKASYDRKRRPRVLINKGLGTLHLDSPCLICNMSSDSIYVLCLIAELETSEGTFTAQVTHYEMEEGGQTSRLSTRQQPIDSGQCMRIRHFRELVTRAAEAGNIAVQDGLPQDDGVVFRSLAVTAICMYSSEDQPFGTERGFDLDCSRKSTPRLIPVESDAKRLVSRKDRKKVATWLRRYT